MKFCSYFSLACLLLLAGTLAAQRRPSGGSNQTPTTPGDTGRNPDIVVRIRIIGGPVDLSRQPLQIDLLQDNGYAVMRSFADNSGTVVFGAMNPGFYRVRASGPGYQTVESQSFEVMGSEFTHQESLEVHVIPKPASQAPAAGSVSAHDAAAPANARKEYEKGQKDLQEKKFDSAQEHLSKAILLYPQFDSAYVLLGNSYLVEKKQKQAEDTFKKGLDESPENPRLEAGMGRIYLQQNNVGAAEPLLRKSVAADGSDEAAVALLARAEYQKNDCAETIKLAAQAHALPNHHEAFVHLLAGSCMEDKSPAEAIKEYQTFLKEDPNNAQAYVAQERIKALATK